ncbi:hypothetical protein HOK51_11135 [Candidatus Woesearchaeota archaeon]|jgi:hypothetical protein|nr:hypothetical protein [Candidatus Woesearchaeota archaeon]MBT6520376.1 hypothetical protein [Candidatus Woesearchaeota archaeon]MBT7368542.1 hypothetical protein [Candidatus Woesearchaeota archaeon]
MDLIKILEVFQAISLVIAMVILLGEHYKTFDLFMPDLKTLLAVIVSIFLITHALILFFHAFNNGIRVRILVESVVVVACAAILISPAFNTLFYINFLKVFEKVNKDMLSHLALGLVPIIIVSIFDIFRGERE